MKMKGISLCQGRAFISGEAKFCSVARFSGVGGKRICSRIEK